MTSTWQNKDACEKELNFTVCLGSSCNIEERRPKSICVSVHFRWNEHKLSTGRLPVSWGRMCGVWKMNESESVFKQCTWKLLMSMRRLTTEGLKWCGKRLFSEAQWQGRKDYNLKNTEIKLQVYFTTPGSTNVSKSIPHPVSLTKICSLQFYIINVSQIMGFLTFPVLTLIPSLFVPSDIFWMGSCYDQTDPITPDKRSLKEKKNRRIGR